MKQPIRVFYSTLSGQFYATDRYRIEVRGDRATTVVTGKTYDVTQDIARAIVEHDITFKKAPPASRLPDHK